MRWPLLPSLHPRCRAQDLVAPGVEPGFAPAQSSVEKQCISVCARVAGYDLPPIYLGGFGVAGKLEGHLSSFLRISPVRQGAIHPLSLCLIGSTLKGDVKAGSLSLTKFCVRSFIMFTRRSQPLQVGIHKSLLP